MIRRFAAGGLALALAVVSVSSAVAEPTGAPTADASGRFHRIDPATLSKITRRPLSTQPDRVVSALVQLAGDPVSVQLRKGTARSKATARQNVRADQSRMIPRLAEAGATTYGQLSTVLNAVQVRVKASDLDRVAALSGVTKVQVSQQVRPNNSASNAYTGVDRAWQYLGLSGKGQTIAVIDTGIDYTHADFGGAGTVAAFKANDGTVIEPGSFPTKKVVAGYDLVGDAYDAASDDPADLIPQPDPDPLDCEGHGSHVAGTAAGNGVLPNGKTYTGPYNRSTTGKDFLVQPGAAPGAKLAAYRVFGCEGSVNDDVIVAAIDRAVSDGADIINMSLGSSFGALTLDNLAIDNATSAGVLVVVSAGNDGAGAYIVGSPSTADTALSVAAADTEFKTYPGAKITGAASASGLVANGVTITRPITGTVVDVGLGCDAADYTRVRGKIALTTRGVCPRVDRATLGQAAGAVAVIMINTDANLPPFEGDIAGVTIPFVGVPSTAGPSLTSADGKTITLTASKVTNPGYGRTADFSSNGPRFGDSAAKPEVTAPGVSIPSVAVGTGTGSIRESGTSMAAPHTAGVAALTRQAHPSWTARQIKAVLQSTAAPKLVKGYDVRRNGTGMVQPYTASRSKVYAWTSSDLNSLKFGMNELSGAHVETQSYKITNRATKTTFIYDLHAAFNGSTQGASVSISPKSIKIKPGETRKVRVTVDLSRSDIAKLAGASASDGGQLNSIRGHVTAVPRKANAASPTLRTAMVFVPVPLSKVQSQATVKPTSGGGYESIAVKNNGRHAGTAELYSWLLADAAGDAFDPAVPDLTNLGVQSLPGSVVGAPSSDRLMVFAASQAKGTSSQSVNEVDVAFDTDGDNQADHLVFTADAGLLLAGAFDGTMGSFVVDLATNEITAAYTASAPANGSTIEFPLLASDIGVTAASPPVALAAVGYGLYSLTGGYDEMSGVAVYDPFTPVTNSGSAVTLKEGQSAKLSTAVRSAELTTQTHAGWLVVTPDDRSGLAEADRVALQTAAPATSAKAAAQGRTVQVVKR